MKDKKKKKKAQTAESSSLLTRLMKGRSADGKSGKTKSAKKGERQQKKAAANGSDDGKASVATPSEESAKPKTALDHSIHEIKHMVAVGENDPERLAMLLSKLLGSEQRKKQEEKEAFDQMVSDIVNKDKETGASN